MRKTRYKVIANFNILDDDGNWFKNYQVGNYLWRANLYNDEFTDEDGEIVIFK